MRWLPPDAWSRLPGWPGKQGRELRLTPPAACGAVVFALARPGCAPDAVTLEAVTAAARRPAVRWRRTFGPARGRTFEAAAPAAPLAVALVEGEADALALARLRLPGVLVRGCGGTSGMRAELLADLPPHVAACLVSDGDPEGRAAVVKLHRALAAAGRPCYASGAGRWRPGRTAARRR